MPGTFGPDRPRARRDDELVERLGRLLARGVVAHRQLAGVEVDRHDLLADADVDAALAMLLGAADDQPLAVGEVLGDEYGIPHAEYEVYGTRSKATTSSERVAAQRLARRAHAGGVPTMIASRWEPRRAAYSQRWSCPSSPRSRSPRAPRRGGPRRSDRVDARAGDQRLKTFDPPLHAHRRQGHRRRAPIGKHLVIDVEGDLSAVHLMSAGRLQLYDKRATLRDRTSRLLLRTARDRELRLREFGTKQAVGQGPARPDLESEDAVATLGRRRGRRRRGPEGRCSAPAERGRCNSVLRDQRVITRIGRSWVDTIL
jgi:hypothetical protein